jgi:hypothetical protein
MNNTWQKKTAVPEGKTGYSDTTYCNKCGYFFRFYEYAILDECPRCGHSLARNYYWVCLVGAALVTALSAVQYFIERTPVGVGSAILVTGFTWVWALGAVGLHLLLRRQTPMDKALRRSVGGWISFLLAFGFLCAVYYPVSQYFGMPMPSLRETLKANSLLHDPPRWLVLTLNVAGGVGLWCGLVLILLSARVGQGSLLRRAQLTVRVTLNSRKCITITGAAAAIFAGAFKPWLGELAAGLPRLFFLGVGVLLLVRELLPPSGLFLAASRDKGRSLLRTLHRFCYPLRFVHLLNIAGAGMSEISASQIRVFSNWRNAVNALSDAVPLLVVDLRVNTSHVIAEVQNIFDRNLLEKTVFVVDERFPDLSLLTLYTHSSKSDRAMVASPKMLQDAMRDLALEVLQRPVARPFETLAKSLKIVNIG